MPGFDSEMGDVDEYVMRVVVADGDPLARRMLRDMLLRDGVSVVAEATNGKEAVELAGFYGPDVVVLDALLPGGDVVETARTIGTRFPNVAIVLVAASPDDDQALRGLRAGAAGYLGKEFEPGMLARILRGVLDGEAAVSRRLAMLVVESDRRAPRAGAGLRPVRSPLTDREWEVLDLLASGTSTEEIARGLVLSTETVRSHLKNLYRKLGVSSRSEAVAAAERIRSPVA